MAKLEWVLFRDRLINGDDSMAISPSLNHWPSFYSIYRDISRVESARHCTQHAFKTFSTHVHTATGNQITMKDLPREPDDKEPIDGKCFQCNATIPNPWEMAGQITTNLGQVV